jgi:hypothetical protein
MPFGHQFSVVLPDNFFDRFLLRRAESIRVFPAERR